MYNLHCDGAGAPSSKITLNRVELFHVEMFVCSFFIFVACFLQFFSFYLLFILRSHSSSLCSNSLKFVFTLPRVYVVLCTGETIRNTSWMNKYWKEEEQEQEKETEHLLVTGLVRYYFYSIQFSDWLVDLSPTQMRRPWHIVNALAFVQFCLCVCVSFSFTTFGLSYCYCHRWSASIHSMPTSIHVKCCVSVFTH